MSLLQHYERKQISALLGPTKNNITYQKLVENSN